MTWSYGPDFTASKDKVRFLVQDTDTNDQLVSNEEIAFILSENSNIYKAAEKICRSIAANLGRRLTLIDPAMRLDRNEQFQHYMDLAEQYKNEAVRSGGAGVFAGGISIADRDGREVDTDRVPSAFTSDIHRAPGSAVDPTIDR